MGNTCNGDTAAGVTSQLSSAIARAGDSRSPLSSEPSHQDSLCEKEVLHACAARACGIHVTAMAMLSGLATVRRP